MSLQNLIGTNHINCDGQDKEVTKDTKDET